MMEKLFKSISKLLIAISIPLLLTQSCSKDDEGINPDTEIPQKSAEQLAAEKFERIKTYLMIAYGTPVDKLKYDEATQEFTFGDKGQYKDSKANIEASYDNANEYKLKYEK